MMDIQNTLQRLLHGNQLKRTARTGWVQRGIPEAENVAAHTFGVAFIALTLAPYIAAEFDMGKLLTMCLLHDLPEALTTDIPTPAWRYLPPAIKTDVERGALHDILGDVSSLLRLWEAFQANDTAEARLVHDADKLDMYLQALVYEQQTGNRQLAEFWAKPHQFYYPEAQALYDHLRQQRQSNDSLN